MLQITGVTKRFGRTTVLDDVSVELRRGSINFLMGPNGAGKTTLIKCVLGLLRYEGAITWGGVPVDPSARRICPVFDDAPFHSRLSGRQNLTVLGGTREHGQIRYLSDHVLRRKVKHYSHGERMRLALVLALNSGAELIILDEPTNGLDRESMLALKRDLRALAPVTTFLITGHNLEFYDDVIDDLFILQAGSISGSTFPATDITRGGSLADAYEEHFPSVPE